MKTSELVDSFFYGTGLFRPEDAFKMAPRQIVLAFCAYMNDRGHHRMIAGRVREAINREFDKMESESKDPPRQSEPEDVIEPSRAIGDG